MKNKLTTVALVSVLGLSTTSIQAIEGPVPKGIPQLDHVFVIMMENHAYEQIIGNIDAPFINSLANSASVATNYFAVAHPSLTNYLEVVGGSNFGVLNDHSPDWHSTSCQPNIKTHSTSFDTSSFPNICPISGENGWDAETPAVDTSNETSPPNITAVNNIDGRMSIQGAKNISGKTIADQLAAHGKSWKSYQEDLPNTGADKVNNSDGVFSNLTDYAALQLNTLPSPNGLNNGSNVVAHYAVKHNPFVYFKSTQEGATLSPHEEDDHGRNGEGNSIANIAGFDGLNGFYADLANNKVPDFAFIAPEQCNDMHGKSGSDMDCGYDPQSTGSKVGLNPGLIMRGDTTVNKLVTAIKGSKAWKQGRSAIIVLWDENDYSGVPNTNQVAVIIDKNYGHNGNSAAFYTHFSLLKSIESAFKLPCLNHACDDGVSVMSDLFN